MRYLAHTGIASQRLGNKEPSCHEDNHPVRAQTTKRSAPLFMKRITLLDIGMSDDGHRASYIAFLSRLFTLDRMGFCLRAVFSRDPVLVPMVEESFPIYALTAVVRSLMGRRTAGLLFRPKPALEGAGLRLRTKYVLLRFLRMLPRVSTLTILPFSLEPRFAEIADSWIHDPQLWDLETTPTILEADSSEPLVAELRAVSAGRKVCTALGRQDRNKGFDWFTDLYAENQKLRNTMLFVFGGKVSGGLKSELANFVEAGGFACDRFVTDGELLNLYASSDLIWCSYDAGYDQASGILGRAVQLGIPVAVRRGSLSQRMCEQEQIKHVAIAETDDGSALASPPPRESAMTATARTQRMRAESLRNLYAALGLTS